jgi:hypothetical protein
MGNNPEKLFTSAGTDINEVKRKNAESGMSYREVMQMIAHRNGQLPNMNNSEEISDEIHPRKPHN